VNHVAFLAAPRKTRAHSLAPGLRDVLVRFIIGDDWTVAAAVAAALFVTWVLHAVGVASWWIPPVVAVAATGVSLRRIRG